jgi:hypothetical protein
MGIETVLLGIGRRKIELSKILPVSIFYHEKPSCGPCNPTVRFGGESPSSAAKPSPVFIVKESSAEAVPVLGSVRAKV